MRKIIRFKSTPQNFEKEEKGIKNNTVRFTNDWTPERWNDFHNATHVEIERSTDYKSFYRPISDKTVYRNVAIISWK